VDLAATIVRVRQALDGRRLSSEAAVRQAVILPILRALGWDDLDPDRVTPEYDLGKRRVDLALSAFGTQRSVLIELKGPNPTVAEDQKQLFEYAFHAGVQFAVLTNGQEWSFFLPAAPGSYDERLLYKLDLVEREVREAVNRLSRYLAFERVRSGEALKDANLDYADLHNKRVVEDALPRAWRQLLSEADPALVDLVAERATSLCGFPASPELVAEFLAKVVGMAPAGTGQPLNARPRVQVPAAAQQAWKAVAPPAPAPPVAAANDTAPRPAVAPLAYVLLGETRSARNAAEIVLHVARTLAGRDQAFLDRFTEAAKAKRRNHVARRAEDVYPGRPQLLKYVVELVPGWHLGTNISNRDKVKLLQAACRAAGLSYGVDLIVNLPNVDT
jgi:hypothetical protein